MSYSNKTKSELTKMCKEYNITGISKMNKKELIETIHKKEGMMRLSSTNEEKLDISSNMLIEKAYIINISDSFVHPQRKMSKSVGKIGHGERRLYIGNDQKIALHMATKNWNVDFSSFSEKRENIKITLVPQNGKRDTRRFYLGVKGTSKENIQHYDTLRKSVIPQRTCLVVTEKEDHFYAMVMDAEMMKETKYSGYSKVAIRWLEHEAKTRGITIRHAENGGEFCIRTTKGYKQPVDGCCEETRTIFEFYGDYYHGNPNKFKADDLYHGTPYSQKWEKDEKKRKAFEDLGYTVVIMWESDWIQHERSLKVLNVV